MSASFALFSLFIASKYSSTEGCGCDQFLNYFTVHEGRFKDVCANITMYGIDSNKNPLASSYLSDHIDQNDNTFIIENGELIAFTPYVAFDSDEWGIIFEGYSRRSTQSGFNIILGPGGQSGNCQLRYENGNSVCIYAYRNSMSYSECISLPYDINQLHTLLLYYKSGTLSVYQNGVFVDSVQRNLEIAFSRFGGWYHTYYSDIAIKNIIFSKSASLAEIQSYDQPCPCDCETNAETVVGLSCITRSAEGEQWVTARGDSFLEPSVLSKHFIADIINDNKKIYKYRIQWFSNNAWSIWYYPGVNDNEWGAKSAADNVWNQAHKDAGRRSWTLFADHFHQVCYLTNEKTVSVLSVLTVPSTTSTTTTTTSTSTTSTTTTRPTRPTTSTTTTTTTRPMKLTKPQPQRDERAIKAEKVKLVNVENENEKTDARFSKWTVIAFFSGVLFMLFVNIVCFAVYTTLCRCRKKQSHALEPLPTKEADDIGDANDEGTTMQI